MTKQHEGSFRRRLALMSGGSVAAVCVLAGAGIGLVATPALAANECGDPAANGTSSDTFQCTGTPGSITYTSTSGNLTLQLRAPLTVTGGISVTPTGTNSVTISRTSDTTANTGDPVIGNSAGPAINVERTVTGGTINVNLSDVDSADTPTTVTGTTAGIRVRNTGTSNSTVNTGNATVTASAGAGVDMGTSGTGALTVTNGGMLSGSTAAINVVQGNNVTVTNSSAGTIDGILTLANTGNTTVTNSGRWNASGTSALRSLVTATGSATLNNNASGVIATNLDGAATSINFGIGAATFNNAGTLAVGYGTEAASTLTLTNLDTWNNSGWVLFGADEAMGASDGVTNDRIVFGGAFVGSDGALVMDVDLTANQLDCSAAVTADCLDLRGGSTAGSMPILVNAITQGAAERIVLVDVGGGTGAADAFTIRPNSPNYREVDGVGTIDGGLFLYELQYDASAQQHALVASELSSGGYELALLGRAASEPWRTATGMWHDRQADLRTAISGRALGYAPGAWLKIAGGFVDETRYDGALEFNTSYAQETTAIVGGVDVIRVVGENSAWVLGLTAGQIDSSLDFQVGHSVIDMEGQSFGAYASVLAGPAFFDAIVNATDLDLNQSAPGGEFATTARSIGYQLEGGYRLSRLNEEGAWIEPLASLTYVRTRIDGLDIAPVTARFDDASSLRAAVGLRVGGDLVMETLTAGFSFTGRLWKEFDGDHAMSVSGEIVDFELADEGMDNLADLGVAVSLFTLGNRLSAHLAYNVLFNDDYQNTGASFGLRYNW